MAQSSFFTKTETRRQLLPHLSSRPPLKSRRPSLSTPSAVDSPFPNPAQRRRHQPPPIPVAANTLSSLFKMPSPVAADVVSSSFLSWCRHPISSRFSHRHRQCPAETRRTSSPSFTCSCRSSSTKPPSSFRSLFSTSTNRHPPPLIHSAVLAFIPFPSSVNTQTPNNQEQIPSSPSKSLPENKLKNIW